MSFTEHRFTLQNQAAAQAARTQPVPGGGGLLSRLPLLLCFFPRWALTPPRQPSQGETREPPPTQYPPSPVSSGQRVSELQEVPHPRSAQARTFPLLAVLSPSLSLSGTVPQHFLPAPLPQPPEGPCLLRPPHSSPLSTPVLCPLSCLRNCLRGNMVRSGPSLQFLSY